MKKLYILLAIFMLISTVSAIPIRSTVSETSIIWEWTPGTEYFVYIDGFHVRNTTQGQHIITDLHPYEQHRIELWEYDPAKHFVNATATMDSPALIADLVDMRTDTTLFSSPIIYFLITLTGILAIITFTAKNSIYGPLIGVSTIFSSVVTVSLSQQYAVSLFIVSLVIAVIAVVITIFSIYSLTVRSDRGWYLQ
jgi:hypothetical protein